MKLLKKYKTKQWLVFGLPILVMCLVVACSKDDGNSDDSPSAPVVSISGVSPLKGEAGITVTLTGENFSTTSSENIVKFGTAAANVTKAEANELQVKVPDDATTGKISVSVGTSTATSADTFTVLVDPTALVSVAPSLEYVTNDFEIGESVSIDVSVTAEEGISEFVLYKSVNGETPVAVEDGYGVPEVGDTEFSATYQFFVVTDSVDDIVEYIAMVKDEDDVEFASASHTIDIVGQGQGGSGGLHPLLNPISAVAFGTQGNDYADFYSSAIGKAYSLDKAMEQLTPSQLQSIDITTGITNIVGDQIGETTPRLISPDERQPMGFEDYLELENATSTRFREESIEHLEGMTSTYLDLNIGEETMNFGNYRQEIEVGKVYSFANAAGSKGYIKVNKIIGGGDNRTIEVEILAQAPVNQN